MRVLIIGAAGAVGRLCVEQSLERGHDVSASARSPGNLAIDHPRLCKVRVDLLDPGSIDLAVPGHDAVILAAGVRVSPRTMTRPVDVLERGTRSLIDAMKRHSVRRLIVLSAAGVGDSRGHTTRIFHWFIRPVFLTQIYRDKLHQESLVRDSGLDWTIARPGSFTNGPHTGRWQAMTDWKATGARTGYISRADVADFLVAQLESDAFLREAPLVTGE